MIQSSSNDNLVFKNHEYSSSVVSKVVWVFWAICSFSCLFKKIFFKFIPLFPFSMYNHFCRAEVKGNSGRGRSRRRWMDLVKGRLSDKDLTIPEAKEWRRIVEGRCR